MSSSMQKNESQLGQKKIIEPPADLITRRTVEKAASFVSKHGLEYETKIYPNDAKFDFLRDPADPHHAYYKHKLAYYSARNQDHDDDGTVDYDANVEPADHTKSLEVFNAHPDVRTVTLIERTALLVSKNGREFEREVRDRNADDPRFNFLRNPADPHHGHYLHRLGAYCLKNRGGAHEGSYDLEAEAAAAARAQEPDDLPPFGAVPEGMTLEELNIIKVTAKFVAWYGDDVFAELTKRAAMKNQRQLEFIKPSDCRFAFFTQVVAAYSQVLKPPREELNEYLREEESNEYLREVPHHMEIAIQGLFLRTRVHELIWTRIEDFANKENQGLPPPGEQKFDESSLVPQGQFLAQRPVSSTMGDSSKL